MTENESLIQISPDREIVFKGPFTKSATSHIVLTNPQDDPVCFKIKTTAPKQYNVKPNSWTLRPGHTQTIEIMTNFSGGIPFDAHRHKFLIQTCITPSWATLSDLESVWKTTDPSEIIENKMKVVFIDKDDERRTDSNREVEHPLKFDRISQAGGSGASANNSPTLQMNLIVSNGNVLRWKFVDSNSFASFGKQMSNKFSTNSIDWKIFIRKTTLDNKKYLGIALIRDSANNSKNWIFELDGKLKLLKQGGDGAHLVKQLKSCYHKDDGVWGYDDFSLLSDLSKNGYLKNGSLLVECEFDFKYHDFSKKISNFTDLIVKVEDNNFHLNKKILGSKSKHFYDLFFHTKVAANEVIKIDDFKAKHFCYMLASFDPFFEIDNGLEYIELIKLANRFGVSSLHQKCEQYLIKTENMNTMDKIVIADANDYEHLMKTCIDSLKSFAEIKALQGDPKFLKLKDSTRAQIMGRCTEFLKQNQEEVIKMAKNLKLTQKSG